MDIILALLPGVEVLCYVSLIFHKSISKCLILNRCTKDNLRNIQLV